MENNENIENGELAPFLGFKLTRFERVLHSFILLFIGSAFMAYGIWNIAPGFNPYADNDPKDLPEISAVYVLPLYLFSVLLLTSRWPMYEVKSRSMLIRRFLWRIFLAIAWMVLYMRLGLFIFTILKQML